VATRGRHSGRAGVEGVGGLAEAVPLLGGRDVESGGALLVRIGVGGCHARLCGIETAPDRARLAALEARVSTLERDYLTHRRA
jgi:hypothetical protein